MKKENKEDLIGQDSVEAMAEARREDVFNLVERKIAKQEMLKNNPTRVLPLFTRWRNVAAIVAIGLFGGALYYAGLKSAGQQYTASMIKVESPVGTISTLSLPDGTLVTLNGGSVLTYPSVFSSEERKVELTGEGYFDVTKNPACPFKVVTNVLDVRVLGTRFNLKAYATDPQLSLTLEEGSVQATGKMAGHTQNTILKPNQQLLVKRISGEIQKRDLETEPYTSWRKGVLQFHDLTLDEIARQLERRFNVKIRFGNEALKTERYFGQFEVGDDLTRVLELLSYKNGWYFQTQGKDVLLFKK